MEKPHGGPPPTRSPLSWLAAQGLRYVNVNVVVTRGGGRGRGRIGAACAPYLRSRSHSIPRHRGRKSSRCRAERQGSNEYSTVMRARARPGYGCTKPWLPHRVVLVLVLFPRLAPHIGSCFGDGRPSRLSRDRRHHSTRYETVPRRVTRRDRRPRASSLCTASCNTNYTTTHYRTEPPSLFPSRIRHSAFGLLDRPHTRHTRPRAPKGWMPAVARDGDAPGTRERRDERGRAAHRGLWPSKERRRDAETPRVCDGAAGRP